MYFKHGKYNLALKLYKRAAELVSKTHMNKDEEKEQSKEIRALLHLNMAACLLKVNEADQAIKECDRVGRYFKLFNHYCVFFSRKMYAKLLHLHHDVPFIRLSTSIVCDDPSGCGHGIGFTFKSGELPLHVR